MIICAILFLAAGLYTGYRSLDSVVTKERAENFQGLLSISKLNSR